MKFKIFFILLITVACSPQLTTINQKKPYSSKGFAYIYNHLDFEEKIIKGRMNNDIMQISHQNLRTGTLIKIINLKNNESIVLKNIKRINYPNFYKILITKPVVEKLKIDINLPLIEIIEIKKNKSFVAKKAKIYKEEKKIPSKAPVASVEISNISKNKLKNPTNSINELFILVASFYSIDTAKFLKHRIIKEVKDIDTKKLGVNTDSTLFKTGKYSEKK